MGTQQILLIVLSVIIVGIAVAVGITMFQENASNQNRQAIIADMNNFASSAMAWYKTPQSHGGAGSPTNWTGLTIDDLGKWIGYGFDTSSDSLGTENGSYKLEITGTNLEITGVGTENGNNETFGNTYFDATGKVEAEATIDPNGDVTISIAN